LGVSSASTGPATSNAALAASSNFLFMWRISSLAAPRPLGPQPGGRSIDRPRLRAGGSDWAVYRGRRRTLCYKALMSPERPPPLGRRRGIDLEVDEGASGRGSKVRFPGAMRPAASDP
jgi:hypothetical protein